MARIKLPEKMAAVPLRCGGCGKHKPLYVLLITEKTKEDSEDYHNGMTEIELGYTNVHYCRQCIEKMTFDA